jgi:hypothetical protein
VTDWLSAFGTGSVMTWLQRSFLNRRDIGVGLVPLARGLLWRRGRGSGVMLHRERQHALAEGRVADRLEPFSQVAEGAGYFRANRSMRFPSFDAP